MKEYRYEDSGIEWLGKYPEHWSIEKLKKKIKLIPSNVDKRTNDDEEPVKLCNYVDVYYNNYINTSIDFMEVTANENELKKFQLEIGDVIITKDSEDPDDIAVPAIVKETEEKLLCGYHLSILRSNKYDLSGEFLFWALKDYSIVSQLHREATGITRWAIGAKHVKNTKIPLPPLPEQKAIADYLDTACRKIDRVITMKEQQIEKIEGYLQSRITELTTKGKVDGCELRTTEYKWIPEVKKSWQIRPLKRLLDGKLKYGANESAEEEVEDHPRYIRITDFDRDGNLKDDTYKSLEPELADSYLLKEGDVLFARSGATVGKTFIFKNHEGLACFAGYLIRARCDSTRLLPEYLYYFTRSSAYEEWKNLIFTQSTIENIGADKYQYLPIPVPNIIEQQEIVGQIKALKEEVDGLKSKLSSQIEALKDYKKSLIHECVTGKKQVAEKEEGKAPALAE